MPEHQRRLFLHSRSDRIQIISGSKVDRLFLLLTRRCPLLAGGCSVNALLPEGSLSWNIRTTSAQLILPNCSQPPAYRCCPLVQQAWLGGDTQSVQAGPLLSQHLWKIWRSHEDQRDRGEQDWNQPSSTCKIVREDPDDSLSCCPSGPEVTRRSPEGPLVFISV